MQVKDLFKNKRHSGFNLSTTLSKPLLKVTELDDISELLQKPQISKNASIIIKQKNTSLFKWLFDFMNKKQGEGSELTYDSIRFEKLSPDLVEALMPVLTMLYNHA